jgi:ABC-type nickel/cobalt efflux system permease component RcnA
VAGGLLPCPSALVILLTALSVGRIWFGLGLVLAFSGGLALVLVLLGIAVVLAGRAVGAGRGGGLARWVPVGSALVVSGLGVTLVVRELMEATGRGL